jgi:Tfp pilus assembly protein PilF
MTYLKCAFLLLLLATTYGCASYTTPYPDEENDQEYSAPSRISSNTAVQNLYSQAVGHINAGDYDQAEASLERGLRIEPSNPYLWFELARLSADYGNVKKARELASRAQSLAGGDGYLQQQIERFVEGL